MVEAIAEGSFGGRVLGAFADAEGAFNGVGGPVVLKKDVIGEGPLRGVAFEVALGFTDAAPPSRAFGIRNCAVPLFKRTLRAPA